MTPRAIRTQAYFDGETLHEAGPYLIEISEGVIGAITAGPAAVRSGVDVVDVPFLMPGLVDGHAHLFLDGGELDFAARKAHLGADFATKLATARANVAHNLRAGVTVVRDAGDRFGVNTAVRDALSRTDDPPVIVRSAGIGLKRRKRYGGFIARDLDDIGQAGVMVADIAAQSDDLKIMLTGIIDFESGAVKGAPQFDAEELSALVRIGHRHGLKTLVHCSGLAGLEVAVAAGVDSIEHGFFMTRDILSEMAERRIAWVPTFSPLHFQWQQPRHAGWGPTTIANLRRILDSHAEHVGLAARLGVPLIAGTDAGSPGVVHGRALIDEMILMQAAGLGLPEVLAAATSTPRKRWGMASADIVIGNRADLIALTASPMHDIRAIADPVCCFKTGIRMLD